MVHVPWPCTVAMNMKIELDRKIELVNQRMQDVQKIELDMRVMLFSQSRRSRCVYDRFRKREITECVYRPRSG